MYIYACIMHCAELGCHLWVSTTQRVYTSSRPAAPNNWRPAQWGLCLTIPCDIGGG